MLKNKSTCIVSILIVLIILFTLLFGNKISYSLMKELFPGRYSGPLQGDISEEKNIDSLEDLIYIPDIKNFKEYFLKPINKNSYLEVIIPENLLYLYQWDIKSADYKLIRKYPVTVGKPTTPTPVGNGIVYTKGHIIFKYRYGDKQGVIITNAHDETGKEFPMPYEEMYGLYLIVNQTLAYVIHSTTESWNIGSARSSGCIRMMIPDMIDLYPLVEPVMELKITYQLFKIDNDMLTIYPDIYHHHTNLLTGLYEFLKLKNINPVIFDKDKVRQALFNELPCTVSLNELLDDYFIKRNLAYNEIKIENGQLFANKKLIELDEFTLQDNKK